MKYIFTFLLAFLAMYADAQTIKMKISGITDAAGEDAIAFQVSDTLYTATTGGGGGGASTTRFELLKLKKLRGTSTNELFKRSMNGTRMPEASFEFYDETNVMFYKIVIKDVAVAHFSYLSPECSNCVKLFHQVWFDYKKIEWTDVATGNTTRFDLTTRAFY